MFKVVLWDYTGESESWAKKFFKDDVEIIRTLHFDDSDKLEVILRGDWNFVLIFEEGQRELFEALLKKIREMNFSIDNIIFVNDFYSWIDNPAAVYALLKPEGCEQIYRYLAFYHHRSRHQYVTASAEGLNYVGIAADICILWATYTQNRNWAADEMKRFFALSKKYYGINDSGGSDYFLDVGANIGTTGLYFIKKFAPNLKLLAFEPDPENFKLLRINTILNGMEDRATLVNCGLGDKSGNITMYRILNNPGGNSILNRGGNAPTETIKIMPLDGFLAKNKISARNVKYIWIDTEGFEAQVLLGAKKLLKKNPAPIFMECNLEAWDKSGRFEEMLTLLSEGYSHFILFHDGEEILYPLEALPTLERPKDTLGQIGDIFLIRKGAID